MSNTVIQIKRSLISPQPSSLQSAELGYSYNSNTFFIGTPDGTGTIAIGGKSYLDLLNLSFNVANAAFGVANGAGTTERVNGIYTLANSAYDTANAAFGRSNSIYDLANAAFDKANSDIDSANSANAYTNVSTTSANNYAGFMANAANAYAESIGIAGNTWANTVGTSGNAYTVVVGAAGNAYANLVGTSGNAYADLVGTSANNFAGAMVNSSNSYASSTYFPYSGGTITGDTSISGNLTVTGTTLFANVENLLVGDNLVVLNAELPSGSAPLGVNSGFEINRGTSPNTSLLWSEALLAWTFTNDGTNYVKIASNTDILSANNYAGQMANSSNGYAVTVGAAANAYADAIGTAANTNAANGSYITTGIVKVGVGGTGVTSFTTNGIVFGNNAGDLKVTSAGTEGQVLQADSLGVPFFGVLDGGGF